MIKILMNIVLTEISVVSNIINCISVTFFLQLLIMVVLLLLIFYIYFENNIQKIGLMYIEKKYIFNVFLKTLKLKIYYIHLNEYNNDYKISIDTKNVLKYIYNFLFCQYFDKLKKKRRLNFLKKMYG